MCNLLPFIFNNIYSTHQWKNLHHFLFSFFIFTSLLTVPVCMTSAHINPGMLMSQLATLSPNIRLYLQTIVLTMSRSSTCIIYDLLSLYHFNMNMLQLDKEKNALKGYLDKNQVKTIQHLCIHSKMNSVKSICDQS